MAVVTPTHCRVVLLPEAKGKAIVETTYELSFTFDVELDLCNPDLHATFTMPDETVPLRGKWECRVFWRSGEELVFNVQHGVLPMGCLGWHTQWRCGVRWYDNGSGGDIIRLSAYSSEMTRQKLGAASSRDLT